MNAFLSVTLITMPLKRMDDITTKKFTMYMWENGVTEEFLRSHMSDIYRAAEVDQRIAYIDSTGE